MEIRKLTPYALQGLAVGIVVGFLVLMFLKPGEPPGDRTAITIKEAKTTASSTERSSVGAVSYASAVEHAAPSVVNIYTTKIIRRDVHPLLDDPMFQRFFGGSPLGPREKLENSLGSGVIISEQGYVLTNNHVIAGADEILVALRDGRSANAQLVGSDPETDIAVLKVPTDHLQSIVIGESENLRVGDVVLAIGNPFGVGQTVTMGIVSATGRSQLGISTYENFIQTDAAINPGNSGGALVDTLGNLMGINTAIFSRTGGSQGIGFAIPAHLAKAVMEQIIKYGRPIRGWLGVETQNITPDLAESFNLGDQTGVVIAGVVPTGPADKVGLRAGDVITEINGKAVDNSSNLINYVATLPPDSDVKLKIHREGHSEEVTARIGERPKPPTMPTR